jgi:hypothetical protein
MTINNRWIFKPIREDTAQHAFIADAKRGDFTCAGELFSQSTEYQDLQEAIEDRKNRLATITDIDERSKSASEQPDLEFPALSRFIQRTLFHGSKLDEQTVRAHIEKLAKSWDQNVKTPLVYLGRSPIAAGLKNYLLRVFPLEQRSKEIQAELATVAESMFSLGFETDANEANLTFARGHFVLKTKTSGLVVKTDTASIAHHKTLGAIFLPLVGEGSTQEIRLSGTIKSVLSLNPSSSESSGFQQQSFEIENASPEQEQILIDLMNKAAVEVIKFKAVDEKITEIESEMEKEIDKDLDTLSGICEWYTKYIKTIIEASGEPSIMLQPPGTVIHYSPESSSKIVNTDPLLEVVNNPETLRGIDPKIQDALRKYEAVNELKTLVSEGRERKEKPSDILLAFSKKLEKLTPTLVKRRDSGIEKFFKMLLSVVTLGLKKWDSKGGEVVKDIKSFITRDSIFSSSVLKKQSRRKVQEPPADPLPKPNR